MKRYVTANDGAQKIGFTLIELLVIIAIITLLAGLLFPVFARAREKARQATCASNLRQIGLAVFQYAQDSDGVFPFGGDPSDVDTNGWAGTQWATEAKNLPLLTVPLAPYIKDSKLWDCPDDTGYDDVGTGENTPLSAHPSGFAVFGMSYGYDTYLAFLQQNIATVTSWENHAPYTQYGLDQIYLMQDMDGSWHGGQTLEDKRYNVLFCDGHVHFTPYAQDSNFLHQSFINPTGQ
jgi:prepilin-type processing-associated H-X9-DG protein